MVAYFGSSSSRHSISVLCCGIREAHQITNVRDCGTGNQGSFDVLDAHHRTWA